VQVDGQSVVTLLEVSDRQRQHLIAGGTQNFVKDRLGK
jgi:aconitate hydratase